MTTPSIAANNDNEHCDEFTRAIPNPSLYEHYSGSVDKIRRKRRAGEPGYERWEKFDCQFISLYDIQELLMNDLANENFDDERETEQAQQCIDAYDRIYELDKESILQRQWDRFYTHANWMQDLFNVDKSIFDHKFDRQCEIHEGYLKGAYMVSALRSFAWTLADYCDRKGVTPGEVSYPVVRRLVDFIAEHDWLNYDGVSYCRGLCDGPDKNVFYVLNKVSDADRSQISYLPLYEITYEGHELVWRDAPAIVRSLDALRRDLAFVYPAIRLLFDELAINRNYFEHLEGDDADLIYTWCSFAFPAMSSFSLEHRLNYDYCFERIDNERDDWYKRFGESLAEYPSIAFQDRRFFFCDLDEPYSVREHPTVQEVIERGGILQGSVTSLTDYLVVNPPPPHRYYGPPKKAPPEPVSDSWIRVAHDYRRRGKHIEIVLQKDVEAALEKSPQGVPLDVEKRVTDDLDRLSDRATQRSGHSQAIDSQKAKLVPSSDLIIDDHGTLIKYKGSEEHIILPEGIKAIGKDAFTAHWALKALVLSEGVQEIKPRAFYLNAGIRHITFPSTLRSIGEEAFSRCTNLTKIVFPEGLERIGQEAFSGCRNLEEIKLPGTLRTVPWRSFQYCDALRHIDIPEGIETIGGYAFKDCYSIKEIRLPSTLRAISKHSFQGCHALTHIDLPAGIETIGDYAFMDCYSIKEIRLPSTLRVISKCSFQGCHALTHIDMPEGIKTIGDYAFMDCYSLAEIQLPSTLQKICYRAFCKCSALKRIAIPEGVKSISASAFELCEQLNSVVFSGWAVPDVPFTFGDSVSSAKLRRNLQRIGKEAFKFCYSLVEIDIPKGITSIEPMAFEGCVNLAKVTLPSTLRTIGARAFFDCQALESLVIPDRVKEIGDSAFERCRKLKDINLPTSVKMIGDNAFALD